MTLMRRIPTDYFTTIHHPSLILTAEENQSKQHAEYRKEMPPNQIARQSELVEDPTTYIFNTPARLIPF